VLKTRIANCFNKIYDAEQENILLYLILLFCLGIIFSLSFFENFTLFLPYIFISSAFLLLLAYLNRNSLRIWAFLAILFFVLGGLWGVFYKNNFLNYTKFTGKVFVDGVGKINKIKELSNDKKVLILQDLTLCNSNFASKNIACDKHIISKDRLQNSDEEELNDDDKFVVKNTVKKKSKKVKKNTKKTKYTRKKSKSNKTKQEFQKLENSTQPRQSTIINNFINLGGYQEIDREFLEQKENYQTIDWQNSENEGFKQKIIKNPPPKISITLRQKNDNLAVNDVVLFRALLDDVTNRNFYNDFDFEKHRDLERIGGYGFSIYNVAVVEKNKISNVGEYFLKIREIISGKIYQTINGDEASIVEALMIGKRQNIGDNLMDKIRKSGLAHLLSISGLHLAIAASIFFVLFRYSLASSQYLSLRFDLKKVAAFFAILGSFVYLQISGSPITAQRAFLMVLLGFIAVFANEKSNQKRILIIIALILIMINPMVIYNISFQLSFIAVVSIFILSDYYKPSQQNNWFMRLFYYCFAIVITSIFIQITTAPFLIKNFDNVSVLGFLANVVAIPFVGFVVMPLGFLAIFLMPFGLEKYILILSKKMIFYLIQITEFVANLKFSTLSLPFEFSDLAILIISFSLIIIYLSNSKEIRAVFAMIFVIVFACSFEFKDNQTQTKLPNIIFDDNQQFFAIYDQEIGLVFNKNVRSKNKKQKILEYFNQESFKTIENIDRNNLRKTIFNIISCRKEFCIIETKNNKYSKILIILKRNKINDICAIKADLVVNLTGKYLLPTCFKNTNTIENKDFLEAQKLLVYLQ